jgi:hypothetical protein
MLESPVVVGFVENRIVHIACPEFLEQTFSCVNWFIQKIIEQILPFNTRFNLKGVAEVGIDAASI